MKTIDDLIEVDNPENGTHKHPTRGDYEYAIGVQDHLRYVVEWKF